MSAQRAERSLLFWIILTALLGGISIGVSLPVREVGVPWLPLLLRCAFLWPAWRFTRLFLRFNR